MFFHYLFLHNYFVLLTTVRCTRRRSESLSPSFRLTFHCSRLDDVTGLRFCSTNDPTLQPFRVARRTPNPRVGPEHCSGEKRLFTVPEWGVVETVQIEE